MGIITEPPALQGAKPHARSHRGDSPSLDRHADATLGRAQRQAGLIFDNRISSALRQDPLFQTHRNLHEKNRIRTDPDGRRHRPRHG